MGLKVKTTEINGEQRIDPDTMDLLMRLAGHRDLCSECESSMKTGSGKYCTTGRELIMELATRPDCEFDDKPDAAREGR
jgi:hypothetical protein